MDYISTSALANQLEIKSIDLFNKLKTLGWIDRKDDKWILTELGNKKGGQIRKSTKYGEYIVWPSDISIDEGQKKTTINQIYAKIRTTLSSDDEQIKSKLIGAIVIGKHFNITPQRINLILSELGWIEKTVAGWKITKHGKEYGGRQYEHETSGGTYVLWPESILTNKILTTVFKDNSDTAQSTKEEQKSTSDNFRERFPATFRTKDGHMVRSRAEVIIDNALYDYKLAHAYERKLPVEEDLYSDFFIPCENVYLEYWGMENDPKYAERKKVKMEIYQKYDFKLIELNDNDILNLDDHLPKKLLKYGIKVY